MRHNDWRAVAVPDAASFTPTLPVSVIVPCFQAPDALERTLAGLEGQSYPRDLFEAIVVDDGSDPALRLPASTTLDVRIVRQERQGFGLARARNTGARAAAHGILVFLDADMIAAPGLLAAHARWHHAVADALTLGFCAYVSVSGIDAGAIRRSASLEALFAGRPFDPAWSERHMARTADLGSRHDDLFRAVIGNNFGVSKAFHDAVGGCDESFNRYGGEDTEFGYRAQMRGGLLVPVREAFAWHQGRWADERERKALAQRMQAAKLAQLIADPGFRRDAPGRTFTVPRHVVTVDAGNAPADRVAEVAERLVADAAGDLVVRIQLRPACSERDRAWLEEYFGPDPNVRVAPGRPALEAFPVSPFHVTVPAGVAFSGGLVGRLRAALGNAATAAVILADGSRVSIERAWALHRARRTGGTAADFGDAIDLPVSVLNPRVGFRRGARLDRQPRGFRFGAGLLSAIERVGAEARQVRGARTAWNFARWLAGALRWQLRHARAAPAAAPAPTAQRAARTDPILGVEIAALGERSRAVFRASSRVAHRLGHRHIDLVLTDTPVEARHRHPGAPFDAPFDAPVVVLGDFPALSVPAFDPAVHNPVGWVRNVEPRAAALGPRGLLPPGVDCQRVLAASDRRSLRHCHHLEDVAAFHATASERAGTLARIAASGVPVHLADRDPGLEDLLGDELHRLMLEDPGSAGARARESLSIRMRRAALRGHSLRARARQVCEAALADPPPLPRVSVLLATRRPWLLRQAVASVARQRYPRLQLVLAMHGPGFETEAVEQALAGFEHPVERVRVDAARPLGAVLNAAVAAASGTLLAKMDDDDVYGPEHLWDLVLAHEYSGAALVGKFAATVYLSHLDRTVQRRRVRTETWSRSITGGAFLIARADLDRAGGWRRARRHVDQALIDDVVGIGGAVYRTHDAGYLLVRRGGGHTWQAGDAVFLAQAQASRCGWRPELAGIDEALPPPAPPCEELAP